MEIVFIISAQVIVTVQLLASYVVFASQVIEIRLPEASSPPVGDTLHQDWLALIDHGLFAIKVIVWEPPASVYERSVKSIVNTVSFSQEAKTASNTSIKTVVILFMAQNVDSFKDI
jgi:hypothetical protein